MPGLTVLSVSAHEDDHVALERILRPTNWRVRPAASLSEALDDLHAEPAAVVICERDLPDGTWKHLLAQLALQDTPPLLVVSSRLADDFLWAEVLNLGGCDVLAKPFEPKEVLWTVNTAGNHRHAACSQLETAMV
jgi:DNA-binding response OmpR family regulator